MTASDIFANSALISWEAPQNDGGAPITGYMVDRNTDNSERWIRLTRNPIPDLSLSVDNLMEGTVYQFKISAVNKKGESVPSEPCEPFTAKNPYGNQFVFYILRYIQLPSCTYIVYLTVNYYTPLDVPGMPGTPLPSNIKDTSILLSWKAPESDGGAPITDYIIEHKSSVLFRWTPIPKEATTTPEYLVTGLTDNETYEFRVIAVNKAGPGKPSDSCKPVLSKAPVGKASNISVLGPNINPFKLSLHFVS